MSEDVVRPESWRERAVALTERLNPKAWGTTIGVVVVVGVGYIFAVVEWKLDDVATGLLLLASSSGVLIEGLQRADVVPESERVQRLVTWVTAVAISGELAAASRHLPDLVMMVLDAVALAGILSNVADRAPWKRQ